MNYELRAIHSSFCSQQTHLYAMCSAQLKHKNGHCPGEIAIQEWDGSQKVWKEDRGKYNEITAQSGQ